MRHGVNNFDFLRFAAATMVVVSHSYALLGLAEDRVWLGMHFGLGGLGVGIFFVISGFSRLGKLCARSQTRELFQEAAAAYPARARGSGW